MKRNTIYAEINERYKTFVPPEDGKKINEVGVRS